MLELGAAEVEEQGVGYAGCPHVVDGLSSFDLRDGRDRLQLDDLATVKASEVRLYHILPAHKSTTLGTCIRSQQELVGLREAAER